MLLINNIKYHVLLYLVNMVSLKNYFLSLLYNSILYKYK